MGRWIEHEVEDLEQGKTVEEILRGPLQVSGRMIQRLTRSRGVLHNHRPGRLSRSVRAGDVVAARIGGAEEPTLQPVRMDLSIVYEDDDLLVVDKPAGLLVHPTSPSHHRTLAHGIAHYFESRGVAARVRPVHRLDRDTTGLLLIAKTAYAHQHLDRQLREGNLTREYLAAVEGSLQSLEGTITAPIGRVPGKPQLRRVAAGGQPATTRWRVQESLEGATLVRARLETGRTHQIRLHFAQAGHPLIGDVEYGARKDPYLNRYALHSWRVTLHQPRTGEVVSVEAPLPADLIALIRQLGGAG
jgi:23S rRNA pseudouridine1911/1915/1917 synthase